MKSIAGGAKVMIIAGEASGDQHGAKVVLAIRNRWPGVSFFGIGGRMLKAAGVQVFMDASQMAVVGITEVFSKFPILLKAMRTAKRLLRTLKPDLLILIDFPDFNLHIAATAKKLGIPVLYYISPQIWAWRSGRVKKIRARVDHMAVILPFEAAFYADHRVPVTFVGHPLLDHSPSVAAPPAVSPSREAIVIGLLPGSRDREVVRLFPQMLAAVPIIKRSFPKARFVISLSPSVERPLLESLLASHAPGIDFEIEDRGVRKIFKKSTLVVATSGTVTLEAAIAGIPFVLVYKVSALSYALGRLLIRVKYAGLANLIAGKEVATELLQHRATGRNIAEAVLSMLQNPDELEKRRDQLLAIGAQLGGPGASNRVADIALSLMAQKRTPA
ncbi:MAG: lipid-A-disaccharide synthase [Desulfobacterales bacterium]|jgi:lipid-A-disaccharide synthase|nr:lipid-A-disaccharide synthase [Desulfobacterales bacterium]